MTVKIIETNLRFTSLTKRRITTGIVIHHSAGNKKETAYEIHRGHQANGWAGIGYHFVILPDGTIQRGRPEDCTGAHATGHNSTKIGICLVGWFEDDHDGKPTDEQYKSVIELCKHLMDKYKLTTKDIYRHSQLNATICPANCDVEYIKKQVVGAATTTVKPTTTTTDNPKTTFIKAVQKSCGAMVDGIAGPETLRKTVTVSRNTNSEHPVVRAIQTYLNQLGFNSGLVDGIYGKNTAAAVKRFQMANGCIVDGVVTAKNKTWKKLLGLE